MRKWQILGLASLGMCSTAVYAQSSVTLYGIIDTSVFYTNNQSGHDNVQAMNGQESGSRWGLRGSEDLGGGTKAIFVLENGFSPFTGALGQNGRIFGRASYVGVSSRFGTLTAGRQVDPVSELLGPLAAANQWAAGIGAHPGDLDNLYINFRDNNSLKYVSNDYAGLIFSGLYSLGGTAGDFANNRIWSLGAKYANGPLTLAAGYMNAADPNTSIYDGTAGTAAISPNNTPVYRGYTSAQNLKIAGLGGSYAIGPATLGLLYTNTKFQDLGSPSGAAPAAGTRGKTATFNDVEANFRYHLTPALLVGLEYNYTKSSGVGNAQYHQVTIGSDYNLSKRTDIYAVAGWQHASGVDSTGGAAVAAMYLDGSSSTANQLTAGIGLRHRF